VVIITQVIFGRGYHLKQERRDRKERKKKQAKGGGENKEKQLTNWENRGRWERVFNQQLRGFSMLMGNMGRRWLGPKGRVRQKIGVVKKKKGGEFVGRALRSNNCDPNGAKLWEN